MKAVVDLSVRLAIPVGLMVAYFGVQLIDGCRSVELVIARDDAAEPINPTDPKNIRWMGPH